MGLTENPNDNFAQALVYHKLQFDPLHEGYEVDQFQTLPS